MLAKILALQYFAPPIFCHIWYLMVLSHVEVRMFSTCVLFSISQYTSHSFIYGTNTRISLISSITKIHNYVYFRKVDKIASGRSNKTVKL